MVMQNFEGLTRCIMIRQVHGALWHNFSRGCPLVKMASKTMLRCLPVRWYTYGKKPLKEKSVIVAKFDSYGALMINRGNRFSIVFHLFCLSKHELSTTCLANAASLGRFFHVSNLIKKLLISLFYFISLYHLRLDYHYGIQ